MERKRAKKVVSARAKWFNTAMKEKSAEAGNLMTSFFHRFNKRNISSKIFPLTKKKKKEKEEEIKRRREKNRKVGT